MPKGMGYGGSMKGGKMKSGTKGGMAGSYGMDKMKPGYSTDSYKYSSPTARAGSNRHGFSKNPKQASPGRMTSDPFPRPRGWIGK